MPQTTKPLKTSLMWQSPKYLYWSHILLEHLECLPLPAHQDQLTQYHQYMDQHSVLGNVRMTKVPAL